MMIAVIIKWLIILSATINYGYMSYDGIRGLTAGDYLRPSSGKYSGQLGPWSMIVNAVGIEPESTLMKILFVFWGLIGLAINYCFAIQLDWAWMGMLILSFSSLWYLVPGTALSILQIIMLTGIKIFQ